MKKHGFTLAEVLITLGIIGVVAALTMPVLSRSTNQETFDAKHKVTKSDLENAFTTMIANEGVADLTEASVADKLVENLGNYIKINNKTNTFCLLKNGATLDFSDKAYKEGLTVTVDINGNEKPNAENYDKKKYLIEPTGLLEQQ